MAFPYLEAIIGCNTLMQLFLLYLDVRQHAAHKLTTLPEPLVGVISQERFNEYRAYKMKKSWFLFVYNILAFVLFFGALYLGIHPWLWKKSGELVVYIGLKAENEIWCTLAYITGIVIWMQIIIYSFLLYAVFEGGARHGFNKLWICFQDKVKIIIESTLMLNFFGVAFVIIEQKGGSYLDMYPLSFIFALFFMKIIYPDLIAPHFDKFTPFPEGALRIEIEKLAFSLKFPLKNIFVVDEKQAQSSHSNVYIYGLFKNESIVVYDTLLQKCEGEEVVAVIAHELGHWKLNHTKYSLIAVKIFTILQYGAYILLRNSKDLFESFGVYDAQPVILGFTLCLHLVIPFRIFVQSASNLVSRSFEYQADAFASKLGYTKGLRGRLIKLQEKKLSAGTNAMDAMNIDPWYSAFYYPQPTILERLMALDLFEKKTI